MSVTSPGIRTGVSSLGVLHTLNENINTESTASVPVSQHDQNQSVGGILSGSHVQSFFHVYLSQLSSILVNEVFQEEEGVLLIDSKIENELRLKDFSANYGTGTPVTTYLREEFTIPGYDPFSSSAVVMRKNSLSTFASKAESTRFRITRRYNNALVGGDSDINDIGATTKTTYRSLAVKNLNESDQFFDSTPNIFDWMVLRFKGIGTQAVSDSAQLDGVSSTGIITSSDSEAFSDWEEKGWVVIQKATFNSKTKIVDDYTAMKDGACCACDTINQKLYIGTSTFFGGAGTGIWEMDYDGTNKVNVHATTTESIYLNIDEDQSYLFFYDSSLNKIQRVNTDGTGLIDLKTGLTSGVRQICIDRRTGFQHVYYQDSSDEKIYRMDYNGANHTEILNDGNRSYGLGFDLISGRLWINTRYTGVDTFNHHIIKSYDPTDTSDVYTILDFTERDDAYFEGCAFNADCSKIYMGLGNNLSDNTILDIIEVDLKGNETVIYDHSVDEGGLGASFSAFYPGIDWKTGQVFFAGVGNNLKNSVYEIPRKKEEEVVYYGTRDDSNLYVTGRALHNTSMRAGASTDVVVPYVPLELFSENPDANNKLSEPASETDATLFTDTIGVQYNPSYTTNQGFYFGHLEPNQYRGLWVKKTIDGNYTKNYWGHTCVLECEFKLGGAYYKRFVHGRFRCIEELEAGILTWIADGVDPTVDDLNPDYGPSIPHNISLTLPGPGLTKTYHLIGKEKNRVGLLSLPTQVQYIKIDENGDEVQDILNPPVNGNIIDKGDGVLRLNLQYSSVDDPDPADEFYIIVSNDGTEPTLGGSTIFTYTASMTVNPAGSLRKGIFVAQQDIAELGRYTDYWIKVYSQRSSDGARSEEYIEFTGLVGTYRVKKPLPIPAFGVHGQNRSYDDLTVQDSLVSGGGGAIVYRMSPGWSSIIASGVFEVIRIRYDSSKPNDPKSNSIQTRASQWNVTDMSTYYAGSQTEALKYNASGGAVFGLAYFAFAVNNKICLTYEDDGAQGGVWLMNGFYDWNDDTPIPEIAFTDDTDPLQRGDYVYLPVRDRATRDWVSVVAIRRDGAVFSKVPWMQYDFAGGHPGLFD